MVVTEDMFWSIYQDPKHMQLLMKGLYNLNNVLHCSELGHRFCKLSSPDYGCKMRAYNLGLRPTELKLTGKGTRRQGGDRLRAA